VYQARFTTEALEDIKRLSKNVKNVLRKEISDKLCRDPCGVSYELEEPLRGWRSFRYRNYRVVFQVLDEPRVVAVAAVGERRPQAESDVYRRLEALAKQGRLAGRILATLRGF
jgi:mRNA-degrading endonuclease RelE of RelBE toxin-antitoxin system